MKIVDKTRFYGFIVGVICTILFAWLVISMIEVNMNNHVSGFNYSSWNLFKILLDLR